MMEVVPAKGGRISKVWREGNTLFLQQSEHEIRICPQSVRIIRVSYYLIGKLSENMAGEYNTTDEFSEWTYALDRKYALVKTSEMTIKVNLFTGSLEYFDNEGKLYVSEREDRSKELEAFDVYKTVIDKDTVTSKIKTADGEKTVISSSNRVFDRTLFHTRLGLNFSDGEAIYGLGQSDEKELNLRGTVQYLHQANMKIAIPFLVSSRNYGILLSSESPACFCDNFEESFLYTEADEMLDYFLIAGRKMDDVIAGFRKITGTASMLPKWAFGYMQSAERYESQSEILDTVSEFRKRHFGLDTIVQDWLTWDDGMWGQKSADTSRYPDISQMCDELHDENAHILVSIWPNMVDGCKDNKEMKDMGFLFPGSDVYNAFSKDARRLYFEQAFDGWLKYGIDGVWCDSSEGFTPEWGHKNKPYRDRQYYEFVSETSKFAPIDQINAFGYFHAKGIYENHRLLEEKKDDNCKETDRRLEKRIINLTRSGYPGSQKYGTILWSGDISASWDTLRQQIVAGLNFCASGLPYWTFDIGGFFVKKGDPWYWNGKYPLGIDDMGYRELYVRWYQLGAFVPVFRSHGTDARREPWEFGCYGELFYDALLAANRLRYRLMPYIYSVAAMCTLKDYTMMRMLAFDFPMDERACTLNDQFMFGPSIMVCPVTKPMLYGQNSRKLGEEETAMLKEVYLPKDHDWIDFWTNKRYHGGKSIKVKLTMDRIPLFIKSGSIIPMVEYAESAKEVDNSEIKLMVYKGMDASFDLYEDAGDGYGYENLEYAITHIKYSNLTDEVSIDNEIDVRYRKQAIVIEKI